MVITNNNYNLLLEYTLHQDDEIIFQVGDERVMYSVTTHYLNCKNHSKNSYLFFLLQIEDPHSFCENYYGYVPVGGGKNGWPEYRDYDYRGLTNLVYNLFCMIDTKKCKHIDLTPINKFCLCI